MKTTILALLAGALLAVPASAQTPVFIESTQPYTPLTTGTPITFSSDDEGFVVLPLQFPFPWFGQTYNSIFIHVDGLALIGGPPTGCTGTSGYCALYGDVTNVPNAAKPNNLIAPFYDDLEIGGGVVRYTSTPGEFVVEWYQIEEWLTGTYSITAQVRLSPSGSVVVHYGPKTGTAGAGAAGFEGPTGALGASFLSTAGTGTCNSATQSGCCSTTAPNCTMNDIIPNKVITIGEPNEADLGVPSVTISNLQLVSGGNLTFDVQAQIRNYGKTAASDFLWRAYLSTDRVKDAGDQLVASGGPVSVGITTVVTVNGPAATTTPPAPGAYYVLVEADPTGVVMEASEANNVGATADSFVQGLDLVATNINGVASTGGGNVDPIQVSFYNRGTNAPGPVTFRILLSNDATPSMDDFLIHEDTRTMSGGQTINETINVTMPANSPNGDYFYVLVVDPAGALSELSETNNAAVSGGRVSVRRADLVAEIADILDATTGLSTRNGKFGEPIKATVRLSNQGGANASNFSVALVLSNDATVSLLSDLLVCEQVVTSLPSGGAAVTVELTCTLPVNNSSMMPLPTGQYFFFLVVDSTSAIYESNKGNNNIPVGPVRVTAPGADLTTASVTAPAAAGVGEVLPVVRTLRNIGNVDAPAVAYRYYVSANDIITREDVALELIDPATGTPSGGGMVTLAKGAADSATELVRLPPTLPAGAYYLGCIIDPEATVAELERGNNAGASRPMQVAPSSLRIATAQLPDATVGKPYSFRLAAMGEQGASRWTIDESQGAKPTWLSLDETNGSLSGEPSGAMGAQVLAFTVVLENNNRKAAQRLALRVLPPTTQVEITTTGLPAIVNSASSVFSYSLGAAGGVRPYAWRVAGGTLPSGLTLTSEGVLAGAPRGVPNGNTQVTFEVTDASGGRARKALVLRLVAPGSIVFRTISLADALMGQEYLQDIAVENSDGSPLVTPLLWRLDGTLPDGLSMTEQSEIVTLSGRPTVAGVFSFGISVEDANGRADTMDYTLVVYPPRYKIGAPVLPDPLRPGEEVNVSLTVSPAGSVTWKVVSGALPPGLTLSEQGVLSGTVAEEHSEGTWSFVVEARDARNSTGLSPLAARVEREQPKGGCSAAGGGLSGAWLALVGLLLGLRRRWSLRLPRAAGLVAAVVLLAPAVASAQTYQVVGPQTITFQALGTGGLPAGQNVTAASNVALPFDFPFYTSSFSSVAISAHGYLAVGGSTATDSSNETVPHSSSSSLSARAFIAPWWDSMTTSTVTYKYAITGVAPNRVAIFEWNNIAPSIATTPRIVFQALLYETTGRIRFAYSSAVPGTSSASVGVQSELGNGVAGLTCGSTANCASVNYPASSAIDYFLPPDLDFVSLSVPQTGFAGVAFPVTASVRNRGGRDAASVDVRFYLSTDAAWDAADQVIGTQTAANVPAGATVQVTSSQPLPMAAASGSYYVIAKVDPDAVLPEQNELNNTSTPIPMTIGMPTADLVVSAFSSPSTAEPGAMLQVTRSFQNVGNAASSAAKFTYFLSDNSVVSVSDRALSPVGNLGALTAGQVDLGMDTVALPGDLIAGPYWLGVCVNYDGATGAFGGGEITIVNNCVTGPEVRVSTSQLAITTTALPAATQYAPYGLRLQASGGTGQYVWEVNPGSSLPVGLSLSPLGDLTGAPATTGTFAFDVKVTSGTLTQTGSLSLTVAQGNLPLVIVDQALPAAEFGRAYNTPLIAVGGKPPYTWTVTPDTQLPDGLALSTDGRIEGRGSSAGDFTFGVEVKDSAGTTASKELSVRVVTPTALAVATTALETGFVGREYLQPLVAVGGRAPYAWTVVRMQQLPENPTEQPGQELAAIPDDFGLVIEDGANDDFLRGAPRKAGLYTLTLKVTDGTGTEDTSTVMLYVTYRDGLAITSTVLPDAFINNQYTARLSHNGGRDAEGITFALPCVKQAIRPGEFVCTGADPNQILPMGLLLGADGLIAGTPTGPEGIYSFLVKLTDASGRQDVRGMSIRVRADFTQQKSGGCSGTGLDPSALAVLGLAVSLWRRRRR
ncbi:MAG: putative Ig domain-containing protein [Myxococcales bacterium]|nr:putative Ig domain-containing protein [Myxococcales bacterium]